MIMNITLIFANLVDAYALHFTYKIMQCLWLVKSTPLLNELLERPLSNKPLSFNRV